MCATIAERLRSRESPVDLVLVGLGFMGYGFLRQVQRTPGLRLPLVVTRSLERARAFLAERGFPVAVEGDPAAIRANADRGVLSLWPDYRILAALPYPIVVEMTGDVAYGTQVALVAFRAGKHLATMNVELHATVGSELERQAAAHGVVVTDVEGDQPGTLACLVDDVALAGFRPLMAGNVKGFLDRQATPATLGEEAARRGLSLRETTAFTDGTKIALEMTLVANHLGMRVLTRGMHGHPAARVEDALHLFDWQAVAPEGCVDYIIGRSLPPGVFLVCEHEDAQQASYLRYLKLGDGPRYLLWRPFHLCHLEAVRSIARLALFQEPTISNTTHPTTQTVAYAKKDLRPGEVIDGIGGYACYGLIENLDVVQAEGLVPMGLVAQAIVRRPVGRDRPLLWDDVILPENAATRLWAEGAHERGEVCPAALAGQPA